MVRSNPFRVQRDFENEKMTGLSVWNPFTGTIRLT